MGCSTANIKNESDNCSNTTKNKYFDENMDFSKVNINNDSGNDSGTDTININILWFDEKINNNENQLYFNRMKTIFKNVKGYNDILDESFEIFYKNNFEIIYVIVSGRLFGKYIKKINSNINKIINLPYTYIFTLSYFKKILLKELPDSKHRLSYDTMKEIKDDFYNPGGVYDDLGKLINDLKNKEINPNLEVKPRKEDKINYEGILTFEYLNNEGDLLAPALYKDIITIKEITENNCNNFYNHILSFNDFFLNNLLKKLSLFKNIPFEILSKYWARFYTFDSNFYRVLNNNLMKSNLTDNYKTFINMLYKGVEINSLKSFPEKYLYRGSSLNKNEIEKIKKYKSIGKLSTVVVFSKAFLSFSEKIEKANTFCKNSNDTKLGCLYILENENKNLHESNADIQTLSKYPDEKEILFFPGSSFIIKDIKEINENKIEIILNYNGKFKEKYNSIYDDKEKINNLINNNILTKNIAGKELIFLKGGRYLMEKKNVVDVGNFGFGGVFKGKDLETDKIVAIKEINYKGGENYNDILNEIRILKIISKKVKNSIKYIDSFKTKENFYIIEEYYDDDLSNFFKKEKKLPPNLIKKIFMQLNLTFKELINHGIVHRDIKPENILIKYSNRKKTNFDSILADYGLSTELIQDDEVYEDVCGTPSFMAPEVKKGYYNNKCDLFSIGVTIYLLYFGKFPYYNGDRRGKVDFNFKIEEDSQLEDLLRKLLKENPKERISWNEYFEHPFFKQYEY